MNNIEALFRRLSSGVYVVGATHGDQRGAFTAAWVMQVSYEPLMLALSINPQHATYPLLQASRTFTVNVLKSGALDLARRFGTRSGRDGDKLAGVAWHAAKGGAPVLDDALAYFDCEVARTVPAGDHELVVARVIDGKLEYAGGDEIKLSSDNSAADPEDGETYSCMAEWAVVEGPPPRQVAITYDGDCERSGRFVYQWNGQALAEVAAAH
jgi:flavin reductase (DIM6/NTAB) family NADH-FMN oxidoreductase RutF